VFRTSWPGSLKWPSKPDGRLGPFRTLGGGRCLDSPIPNSDGHELTGIRLVDCTATDDSSWERRVIRVVNSTDD